MKRRTSTGIIAIAMVLTLVASACGRDSDSKSDEPKSDNGSKTAELTEVPGFDGTTIQLGVLTPETGPAAVIGDPLTAGNKAYFDMLNDEGGIDGKYKVELNIKDNKYTEQDTITQYNAIKGDVVAFLQILGTQPLQALQPQLEKDGGFAGPATLDAPWYEDEHLMPILGPYQVQATNSVAYYVEEMDGAGKNLCTLTSNDAYGEAGKAGADFAADQLDVEFAEQQSFAVGTEDYTAQISALQDADCDMVWLTSLPTESIPLLKRAVQVDFAPQWMAQSPAWVGLLPALTDADYLADNFILATEGVEWGDTSVPGMETLIDAVDKFAPDQDPDVYFVFGWMQAHAMTQILTNAIENGDLSSEGVLEAAGQTKTLTFDGIVNDETFGTPDERDPSRATSLYHVTPDTKSENGSLTPVADNSENFSSDAAEAFDFHD